MHNRWQCPHQRTHYLSNDITCPHCKCFVCNISLDICGVNSHKWAAPVSVLNWESMRPRIQPYMPFDGIELFNRQFKIIAVHMDMMIQRTGVEADNVVRYMSKPVPVSIWHYLKSAVRIAGDDDLTNICIGNRDSSILSYMGHNSYMFMKQIRGNITASLRWVIDDVNGNYLDLVVRIRRSAWNVNYLPEFSRFAHLPPPGLTLIPQLPTDIREMFPHQQMALRDMLYVEQHSLTHSLWKTIYNPTVPNPIIYMQHGTQRHQNATLSFFVQQDECIAPDGMVHGGLLCNDRGTGKTYVIAALIHTHRAPDTMHELMPFNNTESTSDDSDDDDEAMVTATPSVKRNVRQTLVVVPAANLLQQWVDELEMLGLRVTIHHGRTRIQSFEDLQQCDVVLTTFDTLRTLWFGATQTVFHHVIFWRVVWDECHRLLQGQSFTRAGVAAVEISARNRWGLTATPDTSLSRSRLYAQLIAGPSVEEGLAENSLIHRFILHPERYSNEERLPIINAFTIMHNAGNNVMPEVRIHRYAIPLENNEAYAEVIRHIRHTGTRFGGIYLMRVFNNLLANINGIAPMKWPAMESLPSSREAPELPPDVYECSICLGALNRPVRSDCQHFFCHECITRWLRNATNCPLCRGIPGTLVEYAAIVDHSVDNHEESNFAPSGAKAAFLISKIEQILSLPDDMGQPQRILVFSRYVQMRQLLLNMLGPVATSDIAAFHNGDSRVLIMSFLSGSVGLNLMQANHVVLCEPCFRTSTEEQAIGRAARLGQNRVVNAHYVTMQGTIEDEMTNLPRHSRLSIQSAFGI